MGVRYCYHNAGSYKNYGSTVFWFALTLLGYATLLLLQLSGHIMLSRWLRLLPHAIALPTLPEGEEAKIMVMLIQVNRFWLHRWVNCATGITLIQLMLSFADQLGAVLGLGLGILAQAGDLLESAIKGGRTQDSVDLTRPAVC